MPPKHKPDSRGVMSREVLSPEGVIVPEPLGLQHTPFKLAEDREWLEKRTARQLRVARAGGCG